MKNRSIFIFIMLFVVIIFSIGIAASTSRITKTLIYNNIKVTLNGTPMVLKDSNGKVIEPFTIDGTAYLPVSTTARALGLSSVWDGKTNTIKLTQSGVLKSGTIVYEDEFVRIEFVESKEVDKFYTNYNAIFNVKNKTDIEITLQPSTLAFNGISYQFSGSEDVAPNSTGRIAFYPSNDEDVIPVSGITSTSGTVRIIDFSYSDIFNGEHSYDVSWVNITA